MRRVSLFLLASSQLLIEAVAQTWCGKHYKPGDSVVTPGGNFPLPASSTDPLLAFRCAPAIRPYLAEDVSSPAAVLIDSPVVYSQITNATPISLPAGSSCSLTDDGVRGFPDLQWYIHPVPTFDNMTVLDQVLDRMQEVGIYLMYDMRFSYMNATSVTEQVNAIKNRPNLLLWYTADEPDGTSDPLNATSIAYDLIYTLDGYHPVSLVLNCQDYHWPSYTAGTDIVMHDVFMVGTNVTFSNEWQTSCTPDFGDCGCDNCMSIPAGDTAAVPPNTTYYGGPVPANNGIGSYFDISDRGASFENRLQVTGWERTKAVWTVPQGFGGEEYWVRPPTGEEWVLQSIMGINQGALGVVSWEDPTTADIKASASALAQSLPKITPFLFDPVSVRTTYVVGGGSVSAATWDTGTQILVLATNAHYVNQTVGWEDVGVGGVSAEVVFTSGVVETSTSGFTLGAAGSGAFTVTA